MLSVSNKQLSESDFFRLFVKNEEIFRAYARVLLPCWESVDEVMQESSVVMWRKLGQLDNEQGFLPWGKVIVRFEALKFRRNKARDRHVFSETLLDLIANEASEEPEESLESEWKALNDCLAKFSPSGRELLMAPYRGRGEVIRLATQCGRTVNSLYKQIGRLREKLANCAENQLRGGVYQ